MRPLVCDNGQVAAQLNPVRVACTVLGHRYGIWQPTPDQRGATRICARCHDLQGWSRGHPEPMADSAGPGPVLLVALAVCAAIGLLTMAVLGGDWPAELIEGFAGS